MLRFFKSNNPLILLLFPVIAFLFSGRELLLGLPENSGQTHSFLSGILLNSIHGDYDRYVYLILSTIFLTAASFMIIMLVNRAALFEKRNFFPGFLFLFVAGTYNELPSNIPILISTILVLAALSELLSALKEQNAIFRFFNISLFISISSFFYMNSLVFVLPILMTKILIRPQNGREWISAAIGLFLPYFFLFSIWFIIEGNTEFLTHFLTNLNSIENEGSPGLNTTILYGYILFMVAIASFGMFPVYSKLNIQTRDFLKIFGFLFIVGMLAYLFSPWAGIEIVIFIAFTINIPLNYFFNSTNRKFLKFLFFVVFLLLIGLNYFNPDLCQITLFKLI